MAVDTPKVYQFKIKLLGIEPDIWRRIQVPEDYTFRKFHVAIQCAMGWTSDMHDYHSHQFRVRNPATNKRALIGDLEGKNAMNHGCSACPVDVMWIGLTKTRSKVDENKRKISQYFNEPGVKGLYEYDFGDQWEHLIELESILPAKPNKKYPKCIAGKRACPPEDAGGVAGYYSLLEILSNPNHREYQERKDWLENVQFRKNFDPERFDVREVHFTTEGESCNAS